MSTNPGTTVSWTPSAVNPARITLDGDPLDPVGGGNRIGYARACTRDQNLRRQLDALTTAGCRRVFTEKQSGRTAPRPELGNCLEFLQTGDTLVVLDLSRFSHNLQDLIALVGGLRKRGIGFTSLHENLNTTTPGGRLVFHVFAALAEFIHELIVENTHEGLAAARASGMRLGRPPAMTPDQIRHARALLSQPDNTISSIATLLGVSRTTIYKYLPELAGGRGALTTAPTPIALPTSGLVIESLADTIAPASALAAACPTCGTIPTTPDDRIQLSRDLTVFWLYADPAHPHGIRIQRHCRHCQPHNQLAVVECALCRRGPMLAGELATAVVNDVLPELALRRLAAAGWHTEPDLICPDHQDRT